MPVLKLYHSGLTGGIPPMTKNHNPPKRGEVTGWSASASKRNVQFLRSVRPDSLTGESFALTLTLRDCPSSPDDWHKIRRAFIERLRRRGLIRLHWVTEWQRRGVPHLHGMAFFPFDNISTFDIVTQWLEVAEPYGCLRKAQYVNRVTDVIGWFKYLSKHAARGHMHYQRNKSSVPKHWHKTGRVWGYVGDWQTDEAITLSLPNNSFYAYRRLCRAWRKADARKNQIPVKDSNGNIVFTVPDYKRIASAKRCLKIKRDYSRKARRKRKVTGGIHPTDIRNISNTIGVNEWVPLELALSFCDYLKSLGYEIES